MKTISKFKIILGVFVCLNHNSSQAGILLRGETPSHWQTVISCEGSAGTAVVDEAFYLVNGQPFYKHQLVIRDVGINHYLEASGAVAAEISEKFPSEIIIPVMRMSTEARLTSRMGYSVEGLNYELNIKVPEMHLRVFEKSPSKNLAEWTFRGCKKTD